MKKYIALLKGINVGGHKKVPMAELRALLSKVGLSNVQTYIQTGNVFFETKESSSSNIEKTIRQAIHSHFGFEVLVMVKTRHDLQRIFNDYPFTNEKKEASYFMMLHNVPSEEMIVEASKKVYEFDQYVIKNDCIYLFCDKGMGKSKFNTNFFENKLNTFATARNYKTMLKLLSLSS